MFAILQREFDGTPKKPDPIRMTLEWTTALDFAAGLSPAMRDELMAAVYTKRDAAGRTKALIMIRV